MKGGKGVCTVQSTNHHPSIVWLAMNQRSIFFFSQIISLLKFSFASLSLTGELSLVLVNKQWADLFRQDLLWNAALLTTFPLAANRNRWPGQACPKGGSFAFFFITSFDTSIFQEIYCIVCLQTYWWKFGWWDCWSRLFISQRAASNAPFVRSTSWNHHRSVSSFLLLFLI